MDRMFLLRSFSSVALILAATTSACAALDAKDAVVAAHARLVEKAKYRMVGTSSSPLGTKKTWAEVHLPDRVRVGGEDGEYIMIPGEFWGYDGDSWQLLSTDESTMPIAMLDVMRQEVANMTNVREAGKETVNGRSTTVYEYDTLIRFRSLAETRQVKVYLDDDGYIVRQESTGELADIPGMWTKSSDDFEYDDSIKIAAPMHRTVPIPNPEPLSHPILDHPQHRP